MHFKKMSADFVLYIDCFSGNISWGIVKILYIFFSKLT